MKKRAVNSSRMPVYRDAGFELFDAATTASAFRSETEHEREPDFYIYSRYRNPTVVSAEEEIMKLEECNWALLTQTGMSAIDTALSVFHERERNRPWVFFSEIYGGTISFIESVLKGTKRHRYPLFHSRWMEIMTWLSLKNVLEGLNPAVVYIETISNPMLIVADVSEIIRIAGKYGSKVIVDNTFATPCLYRPLGEGADIVIHSATKYFSGHGNLSAGVICGNDKQIMQDRQLNTENLSGHMLSPDDAYRLQTQILTFELRFGRQCRNASGWLIIWNPCRLIGKVWYPGLKKHTTHEIAKKLFCDKGLWGNDHF